MVEPQPGTVPIGRMPPCARITVLGGGSPAVARVRVPPTPPSSVYINYGESCGAIALAGVALSRRRRAANLRRTVRHATHWLREQHTGHVGDQVTWLVAGLALLAGLSGFALR